VLLAEGDDVADVVFDPVGKGFDVRGDLVAEWGEAVLDLGRDGWVDGAEDEAVGFEGLEGLGEHLLADAADAAGELAEAVGAVEQDDEDEQAPAGGEVVEDDAGGAVGLVEVAAEVGLGPGAWLSGNSPVFAGLGRGGEDGRVRRMAGHG